MTSQAAQRLSHGPALTMPSSAKRVTHGLLRMVGQIAARRAVSGSASDLALRMARSCLSRPGVSTPGLQNGPALGWLPERRTSSGWPYGR